MSGPRIGSLFSGAGALDMGIKAALGGETVFVADVCRFDKDGNLRGPVGRASVDAVREACRGDVGSGADSALVGGTMTADTLRTAADRLRTLAQATDGEWYSAAAWATASPMSLPIDPADAALIAAMSPPVALAVCDLLDAEANRTNTCRPCDRPDCEATDCRAIRAALAVAEVIGGQE